MEFCLLAFEIGLAVVSATEGLLDTLSVKRIMESASGPPHDCLEFLRLAWVMWNVRSTALSEASSVMWVSLRVVLTMLGHGDTEQRGEDS